MATFMVVTLTPLLVPSLLYPLIFVSLIPPHPTPLAAAKIREAISAFHCILATTLSLYCLYHHDILQLLSPASLKDLPSPAPNASLPIITIKSGLANAITAYETGYTLADTLIILYARHIHFRAKRSTSIPANEKRGLNIRHLLTHHIPVLIAFLLLQLYILMDWERGVMVILLLMLQNFSSPFGTVRWYLGVSASQRPAGKQRTLMLVADTCYIIAYAICRVWLLYWIIAKFAGIQGRDPLEGFRTLKWHCQMGTLGMLYVNVRWLAKIVKRAIVEFVHPKERPSREKGKNE